MLKRKKQTLNELVSPQVEKQIAEQVEARLNEALESRKRLLEEEIDLKREEERKKQEELQLAIEDRKRRIQEEIELEKMKLFQEPIAHQQALEAAQTAKLGGSQFESRLNYRRSSLAIKPPSKRGRNSSPPFGPKKGVIPEEGRNVIIEPDGSRSQPLTPLTPAESDSDTDPTVVILVDK